MGGKTWGPGGGGGGGGPPAGRGVPVRHRVCEERREAWPGSPPCERGARSVPGCGATLPCERGARSGPGIPRAALRARCALGARATLAVLACVVASPPPLSQTALVTPPPATGLPPGRGPSISGAKPQPQGALHEQFGRLRGCPEAASEQPSSAKWLAGVDKWRDGQDSPVLGPPLGPSPLQAFSHMHSNAHVCNDCILNSATKHVPAPVPREEKDSPASNGDMSWSSTSVVGHGIRKTHAHRDSSHSKSKSQSREREKEKMKSEMLDLRNTLQEQAEALASFRGMMEGALQAKDRELVKLRSKLEAANNRTLEREHSLKQVQGEATRLSMSLQKQQDALGDVGLQLRNMSVERDAQGKALREDFQAAQASLAEAVLERDRAQQKVLDAEIKCEGMRTKVKAAEDSCKELEDQKAALGELLAQQEASSSQLEGKVLSLEEEIQRLKEEHRRKEMANEVGSLREELARCLAENKRLASEREAVDSDRRSLRNQIQELRGNIRVVCRIRPFLDADEAAADACLRMLGPQTPSGMGLEIYQLGRQAGSRTGARDATHKFVLDCLLDQDSTQSDVFAEVSGLVQSVMDGYRVCVFAYGQTGSGKTFTMEGPAGREDRSDQSGLISRAVDLLFKEAAAREEHGWSHSIQVSFLEIYNEGLRDLLDNRYGFDKKMEIKTDTTTGMTYVTNLITMEVLDSKVVDSLLRRASKARATAATDCNDRSSRSHSVFTLRVRGVNEQTQQECEGVLNLIDLAGSERLSNSGAAGARLKETQNINKSLSCLGDVISALANKDMHIPYRNSRLTHYLQPCLGGNSKTLMLINVSPAPQHVHETLCTLRFASKVSSCDIGTAQRSARVTF